MSVVLSFNETQRINHGGSLVVLSFNETKRINHVGSFII